MLGRKKPQKYVIELTTSEYRLLIDTLVSFRNKLLDEGRYTDAVGELLLKLCK